VKTIPTAAGPTGTQPTRAQLLLKVVQGFLIPLTWWITPRSSEQDERFRERNLRWVLLLGFIVVCENILVDLIGVGEFRAGESIPGILIIIVTMGLVIYRRVTFAGYVLALFFIITGATRNAYPYWSPLFLGQTLVAMLGFAFVLPRDWRIVPFLLALIASYDIHLFINPGFSPLDSNDPFVTPAGALSASSSFFAIAGGLGFFLLRAYGRQNRALEEMVETLEERVRERTQELEDARDEAVAARVEAEEADRVKSQFLASMSHELRTPLNAVLNFTEMMALGMIGPVSEKQTEVLNKSLDSGNHLLQLINDVLDVSKMQSGMLNLFIEDNVNLSEVLASVVATAEPLLQGKPVKLVRDIDRNLPALRGDKRRIRQILLNLLSNAAKFTESGSITLSVKKRSDEVLFAVIDTGPGIKSEDSELIFQPFIQTETGIKHQGGTGLGLPISRHLVQAHGGRIWVESESGEGASFIFTLPLNTEDAQVRNDKHV